MLKSIFVASLLTQASTPDAWITTKTKLALLTTAGVPSTEINVDTVNGMVTLYGKVSTEAEKNMASEEAKKIDGVKNVRDLLQVVPDSRKEVMNANDKEIKSAAERALKADKSLQKSAISVASVDNGVLLLSGHARSLHDHLRAVEVAHETAGVRTVRSEVQSPNTLADEDIWRDRGKNPALESYSDGASDVWITHETKMRLLADEKIPVMDINVDTRNGVVTLFGTVTGEEAKNAAGLDARKIKGVREVRNQLTIVVKAQEERVQAHDKDTKKAIESAMSGADLKHINVEVKNGVARLSGTVGSAWERLSAATLTRSTKGVRSVEDDLRVKKD